jgi:hypothetical protein
MTISLPMIVRGDPPLYTVTEDISIGGLAFMVGSPITTGAHAPVTLITPSGSLDAEIEIRNCREVATGRSYRVGAAFVEPIGPSREILVHLCETGR